MIFLPAGWSNATVPGLFRLAVGDGSAPEEEDPADLIDFSNLTLEQLYTLRELYQSARNPESPQRPGAGS
jgi:hypothetical protein